MKSKNSTAALLTCSSFALGLCGAMMEPARAQGGERVPFTPRFTIATGAEAGRGGGTVVIRETAVEIGRYFGGTPEARGGVRVAAGDVNGDGVTDIITGAGPGGLPRVAVFDGRSGDPIHAFTAFESSFRGGVFVGAGDVDGDGLADIVTGADAGGAPHVKVFDGASAKETHSFPAFDPAFLGGVRVAAGDVDGDGRADIIVGAGAGGGPHVKVFSGASGSEIRSFFAFDPAFTGGVHVAGLRVDGEDVWDIVAGAGAPPGPTGGPRVTIFSGRDASEVAGFSPFPGFGGGVRVGTGDIDTEGNAGVVCAPASGPPRLHMFKADGTPVRALVPDVTGGVGEGAYVACGVFGDPSVPGFVLGHGPNAPPVATAFQLRLENRALEPFAPQAPDGVWVGLADHTGDAIPDLIAGPGPGTPPFVAVIDGGSGLFYGGFAAYETGFRGGIFVAGADFDGDGHAEIVTGPGEGRAPHVRVFDGQTAEEVRSFFAYDQGFTGGVRVATGDVNGDGTPDIVTGSGPGMRGHVKVIDGVDFAEIGGFFAYDAGFTGGIHVADGDVNGDGFGDVLTGQGAGGGPHVRVFSGKDQGIQADFLAFDSRFTGGVHVAAGDVNGDGRADIVATPGEGGIGEIRIFNGDGSVRLATLLVPGAEGFPVAVAPAPVAPAPVKAVQLIGYELRPGVARVSLSGARGTYLHLETSPDGVFWRGVGSAFGTGATVELGEPDGDATPARFARGRSR